MTTPARAPKWFVVFLLAYAANYIWGILLLINYLKLTWYVLQPPPEGYHTIIRTNLLYLDIVFSILETGYFSVVLFLLLSQKRLGWILATGGAWAFVTTRIAQMDIAIRSPTIIGYDWSGLIVPMVINAAFAVYLLRNDVCTFFSVNSRTRRNTIIVSVSLALVYIIIDRLINKM